MLYALLALMAPLWSDTRKSFAFQREQTDTSVSRLLLPAAITLLSILSILWADMHRDELHALGLTGAEPIDPGFLSP